jgi:hypothetical protein
MTDPNAADYLELAKSLSKLAHEAADGGQYELAAARHRDAAAAFDAYERLTIEESKPCTHPTVDMLGDDPIGECQKCMQAVTTTAATDHRADADGNRIMWVTGDDMLNAPAGTYSDEQIVAMLTREGADEGDAWSVIDARRGIPFGQRDHDAIGRVELRPHNDMTAWPNPFERDAEFALEVNRLG